MHDQAYINIVWWSTYTKNDISKNNEKECNDCLHVFIMTDYSCHSSVICLPN